jgi:hypothetical protein
MIICSLSKRLLSIIAMLLQLLPPIYLEQLLKINDLFGTFFSILNGIDLGQFSSCQEVQVVNSFNASFPALIFTPTYLLLNL